MFLWIGQCFSQENTPLFYPVENAIKSNLNLDLKADYSILDVNADQWNQMLTERPETVKFTIPLGERLLEVDLHEKELFKSGFQVRAASGLILNMETESKSVFYQGTFVGYPNAHFALSVLNNEINVYNFLTDPPHCKDYFWRSDGYKKNYESFCENGVMHQ